MTRIKLAALGLLVALGAAWASVAPASADKGEDPQVGQSFRIPYRLTLTNHYLVRVRLNGKGPFNFLVDTGAPFVFVGTEAAKKAGLPEPKEGSYWTELERLDLEGGATLHDLNVRVDDPFQLVGMNALGLPGASIDGILGFTALARFKMEFDPTDDRMTWTRLDFEPKDPFVPADPADRQAPAEVQMMNALGPLMQLMSVFIGKQPEDILIPQGLIGLELEESDGVVKVAAVLPDTPAAEAGIRPGDVLVEVHDETVEKLEAAHGAIAKLRPGDEILLKFRRGDETIERTLNAAEGF
jgi:hypothetical protein